MPARYLRKLLMQIWGSEEKPELRMNFWTRKNTGGMGLTEQT